MGPTCFMALRIFHDVAVFGVHFLPELQPLGTMLLHTVFINDQCD